MFLPACSCRWRRSLACVMSGPVDPRVPFGPEPPPSHPMKGEPGKGLGKDKGKGKSKGKGKGVGSQLPDGVEEVVVCEAQPGVWKRPRKFDEVEVHIVGALTPGDAEEGAP